VLHGDISPWARRTLQTRDALQGDAIWPADWHWTGSSPGQVGSTRLTATRWAWPDHRTSWLDIRHSAERDAIEKMVLAELLGPAHRLPA
jgi:hypothetical protein